MFAQGWTYENLKALFCMFIAFHATGGWLRDVGIKEASLTHGKACSMLFKCLAIYPCVCE
jgi:hypothetical protein